THVTGIEPAVDQYFARRLAVAPVAQHHAGATHPDLAHLSTGEQLLRLITNLDTGIGHWPTNTVRAKPAELRGEVTDPRGCLGLPIHDEQRPAWQRTLDLFGSDGGHGAAGLRNKTQGAPTRIR